MSTSPSLKSYKEVVSYLFQQLPMFQRVGPKAFKKDLGNIVELCRVLGHPEKRIRTIHIAGTNGKGSVTHMLAALCSNVYDKIGVYTSPHLKEYRERIKINSDYISKKAVVDFVQTHRENIETIKPSFFEITVAMAFWWFEKQGVDLAIIETGLGGRLDSTNVILPELSVITNIGNDHKNFLGDTFSLIAREKAGIIKPNVPVVIGENHWETRPVFEEVAQKNDAPITFAEEILETTKLPTKSGLLSEYLVKLGKVNLTVMTDLSGGFQKKNINTALAAYHIFSTSAGLKRNLEKDVHKLMNIAEDWKFFGRWQRLKDEPLVIADGAHNPEGLQEVVRQIEKTKYRQLHLVLGFVMEKNEIEALKIWPSDAKFYLTKADIPRAMPLDRLKKAASELNLSSRIYQRPSTAFKKALKNAQKDDLIFVGGSLYLVAELI